VRLEAVRRPDALHAAMADPGRFGQRPAGPVGRLARRLGERHLDYTLDDLRRQRGFAGRPGGLVQQAVDTLGHEPSLPAPNRRLALAGLPLDRHRADSVGAEQHDPRPPNVLLRAIARPDHGLQPFPVAQSKPDLRAFLHPARLAYWRPRWNHSSAPIH